MSQRPFEELLSSAWKQRFGTREEAWLAGIRLRQGEPLWSRFQRHYERLIALPRRTRRRLQRRLAMSLAALALMLALSGAPAMGLQAASSVTGDVTLGSELRQRGVAVRESPASDWSHLVGAPVLPGAPSATIVVNGNDPTTDCTLPDAIAAANSDLAVGNCDPGSGADVIDIQINVDLTAPAPPIHTEMTLEGNGNTISGDDTFGPLLSVVASGDMTLNEVTLTRGYNSASGIGGGIYISGAVAKVYDSTITGNHANQYGGGIANEAGGVLLVSNSEISGNSAYGGSGIFSRQSYTLADGSSIIDNTSDEEGGGISSIYGTLGLSDSTISGNHAPFESGGILLDGGYALIENSTVADNTSENYTAGIDCLRGCEVVVSNSTISGNDNSGAYGGGLYVGYYAPGDATIVDSTISGNNVAGAGAGVIVGYGQASISRSLISGNTGAGYADEVYNLDTLTVDDHNLFGHDGLTTAQAIGGFTAGATDILATSDGTLPTALAAILDTTLADNGGPTETHALPNMLSPAVNGALVGCADGDVDQRGYPRAMGPGMGGPLCDIGAFELQGAPPTDVNLSSFGGDASGGFLPGIATAVLAGLAAAGVALRRRVQRH